MDRPMRVGYQGRRSYVSRHLRRISIRSRCVKGVGDEAEEEEQEIVDVRDSLAGKNAAMLAQLADSDVLEDEGCAQRGSRSWDFWE